MTAEFIRLRTLGIYASLQTLPGSFRVTLQKGTRTCWGEGDTIEAAIAAALHEWGKR